MEGFRIVLTVLVMLGVVAAILLFERRRARAIERDTRSMAEEDRRHHDDPGSAGDGPAH